MLKSYTTINPITLREEAGRAETLEERPAFMLTQRASSARIRPHIRRSGGGDAACVAFLLSGKVHSSFALLLPNPSLGTHPESPVARVKHAV